MQYLKKKFLADISFLSGPCNKIRVISEKSYEENLLRKKELKEEKEKKKWYSIGNGSPYIHVGGKQGEVEELKLSFKIHLVNVLIIDIGFILLRFKQN